MSTDQPSERTAKRAPSQVTPSSTKKFKNNAGRASGAKRELQLEEPQIALPAWRSNDDDDDISTGANSGPHKIKIVYVDADDVKLKGIAILCEGYGETFLTEPLFKRALKKPVYATFTKMIKPVSFVFKAMKNGEPWMKPDYKIQHKFLAVLFGAKAFSNGFVVTKQAMKGFFDNTLLPALKLIGNFKEGVAPIWSDTESFTTVKHWSELLDNKGISDFVQRLLFPKFKTEQDFFQFNKTHIYSFYAKGALSEDFIVENELSKNHVDPLDFMTVQSVLNSQQIPGDDEDEDDADNEENNINSEDDANANDLEDDNYVNPDVAQIE